MKRSYRHIKPGLNNRIYMQSKNGKLETKELIDIYFNEYKTVVEKITQLSLKFSGGSYIVPISFIAIVLSITLSEFYVNFLCIVSPVVLCLYGYNHIRYMALQFRLSGYARYLEEKINTYAGERILSWENGIARNNKHGVYETILLTPLYVLLYLMVFSFGYHSIYTEIMNGNLPYIGTVAISTVYYLLFTSFIFILVFFTNEHNVTYHLSVSVGEKKPSIEGLMSTKNGDINNAVQRKHIINKIIDRIVNIKVDIKMIVLFFVLLLIPLGLLSLHFENDRQSFDDLSQFNCVIILGNKSSDKPSSDMKDRLDCLLNLLDNDKNISILLSGGNGEAELMHDYLVCHGIPDEQLVLETESVDTITNFANTKAMIHGNVAVITSDYHILRSRLICHELKLNYNFIPAKTSKRKFIKEVFECYIVFFETLKFI